jgi:hypothetical protein
MYTMQTVDVDEIDAFTHCMGAREFMHFLGVKRYMAKCVIDLFATAGIPSDINLKLIIQLPFDRIACLHDDLVRMSGDPYMTSTFAQRVTRSLTLSGPGGFKE